MKNKGFTIIELLVVVTIIGVLATIVTLNLDSAKAKARDAKRFADANTIAAALEMYKADHKQYPLAATTLFIDALTANYLSGYLNPVPHDPQVDKAGHYDYLYYSDAASRYGIRIQQDDATFCKVTAGASAAITDGWWRGDNDAINRTTNAIIPPCQ